MARPARRFILEVAALLVGALLGVPIAAWAGEVTVTLKDQHGAPVADAVVTLQYPGGEVPSHYAQPLQMGQKNLMFTPFVLVVPVGAEVNFANQDKVRHHVYSFSPAKTFELKLFGKDQSHSVRFDKPGAVALGCNIHDNMAAYVKVVDAPLAAKTDGAGRVELPDVPAGPAALSVWHPYMRAPANQMSVSLTVPKTGGVQHDFSAVIAAPPR